MRAMLKPSKAMFRRLLLAATLAGSGIAALPVTDANAATPISYNCNDSGSYSVQVCVYQYGTRSGNTFVLDHYGATFIRKDSQARLTQGTIHTGTLVDGNYDMGISAPTSGKEYTFRPANAGRNLNVSGNGYACGRAELNWARGTGTSHTESFSVCQGNSDLFGHGGDRGGKVTISPSSTASDSTVSVIPDGFFLVTHTAPAQRLSGNRYVLSTSIGVVRSTTPTSLVAPDAGDQSAATAASSQGSCNNDGSISVSVCVQQFYTLSGSYVSVDKYTASAARNDSQARLNKLRARASVLGECMPGSCSGVKNDVQDFAQSSPSSGVQYPFQPRWHGNFTAYNNANRYQCGIAFLDWARGSSNYTLTLNPPVCIGKMP